MRRSTSRGLAGSDGFVIGVGIVILASGAALGLIRYFGSEPFERDGEAVAGGVALGAVVAAPGVLALLALARRPSLLVPAAIVLFPLSFLSFAGILLPLLVLAAMLVIAYSRRSTEGDPSLPREVLGMVLVPLLLLAAAVSLFVHDDPRSYSSATMRSYSSDVITVGEALICVSILAFAIAVGWVLATPRRVRSS